LAAAVKALLLDPTRRDALAAAACQEARVRFDGARLARETGALYDALRAERRPPPRHG
jgi:hypothetical protein